MRCREVSRRLQVPERQMEQVVSVTAFLCHPWRASHMPCMCCGKGSRLSGERLNSAADIVLGVPGQVISFCWACCCTGRVERVD